MNRRFAHLYKAMVYRLTVLQHSSQVILEGDTRISSSAQSDFHEALDLSTLYPDNPPATSTPNIVEHSGLKIYQTDVKSIQQML